MSQSLAAAVKLLTESPDHKVLHRLVPAEVYTLSSALPTPFRGVVVDVETTGLSPRNDKIIEIGIIAFEVEGNQVRVTDRYEAFSDPGTPIPDTVTQLTGITDAMVAGQKIDEARVKEMVEGARLVVAHQANFDRKFLEVQFGALFANRHWACSLNDVPWTDMGVTGSTKLDYLAMRTGHFFDGHRASDDAQATLAILCDLAFAHPEHGSAFGAMLAVAREPTLRLFAEGAPFEKKDDLKTHGYRWYPDRKVWALDCSRATVAEERAWLSQEIYGRDVDLPVAELDGRIRYSGREDAVTPMRAAPAATGAMAGFGASAGPGA